MMDILNKIKESNVKTYDLLASEYENRVETLRPITIEAVSLFMKYLGTGKKILEPGCAVGLALSIMTEMGNTVTGIDVSPEMVGYARKRNPRSNIILGDFLTYEFKGSRYDGIFSFAFIHLFPKSYAPRVLKRMFDLLEPGGIVYTGTSRSDKSLESWEIKKDYKNKQKRFRKHWTEDELRQAFAEAGFDVLNVYILTDPYGKVWMDFVAKRPL